MTKDRPAPSFPTPLDYPDPVVQYTLEEGEPVIEAVNDPFLTVFGSPQSATTLASILGLTSPAEREQLKTGGTVTVPPGEAKATQSQQPADEDTAGLHFHGRVRPPDDSPGYIIFVECGHELGVDRVASVISHDLRNPLDVAKAHLEAIDDCTASASSNTEETLSDHVPHIEQAHGRMERIIEDVLTLARGEDVITPDASVELEAVANCAWRTVDTGDSTLTIDGPLQTVMGDRGRLSRLFENLFRNAIEHGSPHTEAVAVRVGSLSDGFFVEDDGTGIEPSSRERIFVPGHSDRDHGTGLGLAIVKRIAELHGWSVSATEGTTGGARIEIRAVSSE